VPSDLIKEELTSYPDSLHNNIQNTLLSAQNKYNREYQYYSTLKDSKIEAAGKRKGLHRPPCGPQTKAFQ
jgi:hypothetical protein